MASHPTLELIERVLSEHEPELQPAPARVFDLAAVALVLAGPPEDPRLCFIRRAERETDRWSGQMAFPGGRRDAADASVQAVAERETLEEVGMSLDAARLLGRLDDTTLRREAGGVLAAFVFDAGRQLPALRPDPHEVADAFWIPLSHLWDAAHRTTVPWEHDGAMLRFPGIAHPPDVIWGLSLRVLDRLAARVGRPRPSS